MTSVEPTGFVAETSLSPSQPARAQDGDQDHASGSLSAGVARSALWSSGGHVAVLSATLIATPFTIRLLGPAQYGIWALMWSLFAYFQLADLGMGSASTRLAAERFAQGDGDRERDAIWSACLVTVGLTGVAAVLGVIAAPRLVSGVLHVSQGLRPDAVLAFRLMCFAAVGYAAAGVINTSGVVRLLWGRVTLATSGPAVLQVAAAPLVLAAVGGGVVALTGLVAAASVAAAALNFAFASKLQPRLRHPRITLADLRRLTKFGAWLALSGAAAIPLTAGERFFLAHFHSPTAVAYYAVAASLAALLAVIPAACTQPMLSALTRLATEGRIDEHRRQYHQVLRVVFQLSTPSALLIAFLAHPLIALWAGPTYGAHSVLPLYVLLVGLWFNTLGYTPYFQLLAADRPAKIAMLHVLELVPYLVAAAVLTSAFGVIGAAVTWTVRCVVDTVALFVITSRRQRLPWLPTSQRLTASLVGLVSLAGALYGLATITTTLPARMLWSLIVIALYMAGVWRFVFTRQERDGIVDLVSGMLPRTVSRLQRMRAA